MKNIQIVNKLVAREHNYSEDLVELVNQFYWKEVRRKLSNVENISVSIKHIGTITTSKRKIDQFIKTTIAKIRNIRKSTRYKQSTQALLLDSHFEKLRKALKQRNILATQYYETYMERLSRIHQANTNDSTTESEDSRGNHQPSEDRLSHTTGRPTDGDSTQESDMCGMSLQQYECKNSDGI